MNTKILLVVILGLIGITTVAVAGSYFITHPQIFPYKINPVQTACTEEAKQCPDGSYVGRTGLNCEFAQCPTPSPIVCTQDAKQCFDGSYVSRIAPKCDFATCPSAPTGTQVSLKEGQREGSLLVQKIYSNYITGLNFREYPLAMDQGQPITLYIGETASNGCTVTLTLLNINGKTAYFTEKTDFNKPCPICLAENTLIDTPNGQIAVQNLQQGMAVWTVDESGNKVSTTIVKNSKTAVPSTHQMVHIILEDKREILASPGHPIGDSRFFGDLSVGDMLNGSHIILVEKVSYDKGYTYDILPLGETGFYFANGILIDSTLH